MTFWQKHKWKIIAPVLIVLVLAAAFILATGISRNKRPPPTADRCCPGRTPAQEPAESNTPDKVETQPEEPENVPEPAGRPAGRQTRTDLRQTPSRRYLSPEEMGQAQPANMKKWAA